MQLSEDRTQSELNLTVGSNNIQPVESVRHLGVKLDAKMASISGC